MDTSTKVPRERIDSIVALAAAHVPASQKVAVEALAREYFRQLDAEDLADRSPDDLSGALLSHWQLGAVRAKGKSKVRVLSPTVTDQGWASRHSVVEIVNDDMPFLVDSTSAEVTREGLTIHLILHPIFGVQRDAAGGLTSIKPRSEAPQAAHESWMHIEIDRLVDPQQRSALVEGIERVLADVRAAVEDWKPMIARLHEAIASLEKAPAALPPAQVAESRAFLQWLAKDHLTLLGYRQHDLDIEHGEDGLRPDRRHRPRRIARDRTGKKAASFSALPPQRARWRAQRCRSSSSPGQHALDRGIAPATPTTSASSATTNAARL